MKKNLLQRQHDTEVYNDLVRQYNQRLITEPPTCKTVAAVIAKNGGYRSSLKKVVTDPLGPSSPGKKIRSSLPDHTTKNGVDGHGEHLPAVTTIAGVITRYNGGKNANGTYQQIINLIPPHKRYYELCVGSGAIFRNKLPAVTTVLNDKDPGIYRYWCELKEENDLRSVIIKNEDVISVLKNMVLHDETFIYIDSPYLFDVRSNKKRLYKHEAGDIAFHKKLLNAALQLPPETCAIMISGYASPLYTEMLQGWNTHSFQAMSRGGMRTETLWMNYKKPVMLHDDRYLGENYRKREKIKMKKERWMNKFRSLPPEVRVSILSAINREFLNQR